MEKKECLIFRADGNSCVGAGHIMRCISIADAASEKGVSSIFVTAGAEFKEIIEEHNHLNIIMNSDFKRMKDEINDFSKVIESLSPIAVIVDSYYVSACYFTLLRKVVNCTICYIDDMANFAYDCDVLINYNIYGCEWYEKYKEFYRNSKNMPSFFLGTQYVPLRAEFRNIGIREIKREAKNVLISTGGADPDHMTLAFLKSLARTSYGKVFHIIIGSMNKDKNEIRDCAKGNENIIIHENVSNMAKLMISCDVAISAAGSTLYELCATQTPTITYVLEDNQKYGAIAFEKADMIKNVGDIRILGAEALSDKLINEAINLCDDYDLRKKFLTKQRSFMDGEGVFRIIDALQKRAVCYSKNAGSMLNEWK